MGPLDGISVVELAHEHVAWAGKLLADLGADVTVVEPDGGSRQRFVGPFLEDEPGPERSLAWWHYNTGKHSVVADLERDRDQVTSLVGRSDVLLEAEPPGHLAAVGLGWEELSQRHPHLIVVSVTPFGQASTRSTEPITDLTLMAEAGPVWSCGYDDHSLPPVRGGGNQGYQTACHWAVMGLLVALLHRETSGRGQRVDVSMSAANNVTTEMASYGWLAAAEEMRRQTGRHAAPAATARTQARCRDGRYVTTGVPARDPAGFARLVDLLDRSGLRDEFPLTALLEIGARRETLRLTDIATDPLVAEIFTAGREVTLFLAEHLDSYDFFYETQRIGIATGVIYTPGEAMTDPSVLQRRFPTEVHHPELDRDLTYPGPPYRFSSTPWSTSRAPMLGEHQHRLS
ncbi:MAG TPA: CoA transferase [Acidimicrobiales bacterium]|nr:CoA transferase [Acidimicrobiales bacterium]